MLNTCKQIKRTNLSMLQNFSLIKSFHKLFFIFEPQWAIKCTYFGYWFSFHMNVLNVTIITNTLRIFLQNFVLSLQILYWNFGWIPGYLWYTIASYNILLHLHHFQANSLNFHQMCLKYHSQRIAITKREKCLLYFIPWCMVDSLD